MCRSDEVEAEATRLWQLRENRRREQWADHLAAGCVEVVTREGWAVHLVEPGRERTRCGHVPSGPVGAGRRSGVSSMCSNCCGVDREFKAAFAALAGRRVRLFDAAETLADRIGRCGGDDA